VKVLEALFEFFIFSPANVHAQLMKQVGRWNYYYCLQGCEGWALFLLTKVMQWRMEEIQVLIAKFRNALNDRKNHAYYRM
jgi:hypothetical protein